MRMLGRAGRSMILGIVLLCTKTNRKPVAGEGSGGSHEPLFFVYPSFPNIGTPFF